MITIPRAEVTAILERHNDHWAGTGDLEVWIVRGCAASLRQSTEADWIAEADELDALADRYEREAS